MSLGLGRTRRGDGRGKGRPGALLQGKGEGIVVSQEGRIIGGNHRMDELLTRAGDGPIALETPIMIQVLGDGCLVMGDVDDSSVRPGLPHLHGRFQYAARGPIGRREAGLRYSIDLGGCASRSGQGNGMLFSRRLCARSGRE